MNTSLSSVKLALADWKHEIGLSVCGVVALAGMLAPLLVLHGVHSGVVARLKENLMHDPAVLVIMPAGGGNGYDDAFLQKVSSHEDVDFCIGRTRDVAAEAQMASPSGRMATLTLEPTAAGDPMLRRAGIQAPQGAGPQGCEAVLSDSAARALEVQAGDTVTASLSRRLTSGRLEHTELSLKVSAVLPRTATGRDTAFVALDVLAAVQDYRDSVAVPALGWTGEFDAPDERRYASFRAYSASLEGVERLDAWFAAQNVRVKTRARDVANIRAVDEALAKVIYIIMAAAGAGFFAFMVSTAHAGVRRKKKMLGLMRLLGYTRMALLLYPLAQSLCTAFLGCFLACGAYALLALCVDTVFVSQTGGAAICAFPPLDFLYVFGGVACLAAAATLQSALNASRIEPSAVIREA